MEFHIKSKVIDEQGLKRTIARLAHEILEWNKGLEDIAIVGMQTRGVFLAKRISQKLQEIEGKPVPVGILDVTLYRDDFRLRLKQPKVQATEIPFSIDEKNIVLVDDVLYTGRTVRAALDAVMDLGRPASIQLAILIDRGHRELPIKADFIGKNIPTSIGEEISVHLQEVDGEDGVYVVDLSD
ncbi:MAG: bifunctional pyr operon transcriptional regulator/uracil phosphoribosyltransferase PyrR [Patescibacteria group bacterium]|nr:bifunctional pyr operon transcriptional regulator/uracil phosphoribosyltransferase PyrR [Patescibacteria group bacterium]